MLFYIERLGCPKNDTDAEGIEQLLVQAGFAPAGSAAEADIIIVNTCGFIDSAKDESLQYLDRYATAKRRKVAAARRSAARDFAPLGRAAGSELAGPLLTSRTSPPGLPGSGARPTQPRPILIAAGCFSERYGAELAADMPELDGIIGTQRWAEIPELIGDIVQGKRALRIGKGSSIVSVPRTSRTPSAYVKIADGCSVGCAFCAIPKIKGPHVSKPMEQVVSEIRQLADAGVQEVILIAQNTGAYGHDWKQRDGLALLLDRITERVPNIPWIRVMYTYPEHITPRLVETMARNERIVNYLDIPLQHAHPDVLSRMRRPVVDAPELVSRLRESIPEIALRSAFIVGYPGENEVEFEALLSFLNDVELDRVGVFQYSPEDGTLAASLPGRPSARVSERRQDRAMKLLRDISIRKNQAFLGRTLRVLIEGTVEQPDIPENPPGRREGRRDGRKRKQGVGTQACAFHTVGRSYRDAPEVDGLVFLKQSAQVGSLVTAKITGAGDYDLFGEIVV